VCVGGKLYPAYFSYFSVEKAGIGENAKVTAVTQVDGKVSTIYLNNDGILTSVLEAGLYAVLEKPNRGLVLTLSGEVEIPELAQGRYEPDLYLYHDDEELRYDVLAVYKLKEENSSLPEVIPLSLVSGRILSPEEFREAEAEGKLLKLPAKCRKKYQHPTIVLTAGSEKPLYLPMLQNCFAEIG